MEFLCIGGAVVDRTLTCTAGFRPAVSNPVTSSFGYGGVARNVAESLARLGADVGLLSAIGNDPGGEKLRSRLVSAGVGVYGDARLEGASTAEYLAVLEGGELAVAFADMDVFDRLSPEVVSPALEVLPKGCIVFVDCNLPADTLSCVTAWAARTGNLLAIDGVSPAKAERLPRRLDSVGLLFVNTRQVRHVTGTDDVRAALQSLADRGARRIAVTLGADGLLLRDGQREISFAAPRVPIVSVTGAGDAIAAGTLLGLSEGRPLEAAVSMGIALASLALEVPQTVPQDLTRAALDRRLATLGDTLVR